MTTLSDSRRFRRLAAGTCMLAAPALLAVGEILHPEVETDAAAQLEVLQAEPNRQYAAHLLFAYALILFIPALLGVMHLLKARRAAWGHVGAGLGFAGVVGLATIVGSELMSWQAAKAPAEDTAAMVGLLDRFGDSPGVLPLILLVLGFPVGWLVLGTALYLSRASAPWQAVLVAVAPLVTLVSEFTVGRVVAIVAALAFLAGLGSIGWRVLTGSDEDWEQTEVPGGVEAASAV